MNEDAHRETERGTVVVDVVGVSRMYRTRRHESPLWRQLLKPTFETHTALNQVNLQIRAGECLGLVGPNGAGKSTMIKLLTGLLKPSSGRISVLGHEPGRLSSHFLNQIAAVFGHKTSLWWDLPVRHSFDAIRRIYRVPAEAFRAPDYSPRIVPIWITRIRGVVVVRGNGARPDRQSSPGSAS